MTARRGVAALAAHRPLLLEMQCNCYDEPLTTAMCDTLLAERKRLVSEGDGTEIRLPCGVLRGWNNGDRS